LLGGGDQGNFLGGYDIGDIRRINKTNGVDGFVDIVAIGDFLFVGGI
jgi:hypothetical protein